MIARLADLRGRLVAIYGDKGTVTAYSIGEALWVLAEDRDRDGLSDATARIYQQREADKHRR